MVHAVPQTPTRGASSLSFIFVIMKNSKHLFQKAEGHHPKISSGKYFYSNISISHLYVYICGYYTNKQIIILKNWGLSISSCSPSPFAQIWFVLAPNGNDL